VRVAVICLHTSPTASLGHSANGGLNVYVREVCAAFGRHGVATDIFTRRTGADSPDIERLGPLGRVVYLPAGSPATDKYDLVAEIEPFAERVADFAADEDATYDLIYSHYWLSGAVACTLRSWWRIPWAHTAHTLAVVKNRNLAPGDAPEPAIRELLEEEIARSADLLVVSTFAEGEALARTYGARADRVAVVAPGVDLQQFSNVPRFTARRLLGLEGLRPVLFVGRLERLKGVEIALRAFAAGAAAHDDARLLVVGGDSRARGESERARLQAIAAELGMSGRVRFCGSVRHARLAAYYSASEALLMPSYSESFGLVGLEAQACGCPVIAADVAGLASVVRDGVTGYLVRGHDPDDYAERLQWLLDHPELSRQMGRRGTVLAQRFSWARTGLRLLDAMAPLVEASGGRSAAFAPPQLRVQAGARQE
jgi:D-inositol-3-phosphate glycosyltransferase